MAQRSNPGHKKPFIAKVLEPAAGHFAVYVRMNTLLLKDFPNKPWNENLSSIGLAPKDVKGYEDYVLVEMESVKGSEDLYWVFQKLGGPIWKTASIGSGSMVPQKFRRQITTTETKQEVVPETNPTPLTGDLIRSTVQDQVNTGKATLLETSEAIDENAAPLEGERTETWGMNTTSEQLVAEGDPADSGFGVKAGSVSPLGDGKAVKQTESYPDDSDGDGIVYTLSGEEHDDNTNAVISVKRSLVDASRAATIASGLRTNLNFAELKPIDKWHSIMIQSRVTSPPETKVWTETTSISLPSALVEVGVIWDSKINGSGGSAGAEDIAAIIAEEYGWNVSAEASIVGAVSARPYNKTLAGIRGAAQVTVTRTFSIGPPVVTVQAHKFQPVFGHITIHGVSAQVQAVSSKNGRGSTAISNSVNGKNSYDANMGIHSFGPVEFSGTPILKHFGDPRQIQGSYTAIGGSTPSGGLFPAAVAELSLEGKASIEMPSSGSVPLVSGDEYILKVACSPWRLGYWVKEVYKVKVP